MDVTTVISAAQSPGSSVLAGTVTDGTGALIRGASVQLTAAEGNGPVYQQDTSRTGEFRFTLPPGRYTVSVQAEGFAPYAKRLLTLKSSDQQTLAVRMLVAGRFEEIDVLADGEANGTDPNSLAGTLSFQGDGLALLSGEPTTLQQQLQALTGGFGPPQIMVDGFTGGRLPPKSAIRAIRINGNRYSASYAEYGSNRVEIDTKPGTDQLHGTLTFSGTDQPLDAFNPYSQVHPPFYEFQHEGDLSGPLGKKTSFFASEFVDHLANSAVVNAANPEAPSSLISTSVSAPQQTETFSLRVDRQMSASNVAYVRDEWSQTHITNSGILPLVLPEAAFTANTLTNTLQLADTQMIGAHAVNDTRFQYIRTRLRQSPNSDLPSILVEGTFQSGGNPSQVLRDNQDAFEVQDRFEMDRGRHLVRAGFRFRSLRDANTATAGFNGQYIFPDVASYLARLPGQYSQTVGQPGAVLLTNDLAVYAEDDWKLKPNLTFSYGLRFESQTAVPDHSDPAPRIGFAWAIRPGKRKTPLVTLKAGYGIFYNRFPVPQLLASVRQNGVRQVAYVAQNPSFDPNGPPPGAVLSVGQPTIYQVDPSLRSSLMQIASVGANKNMGRFGVVSATLLYNHDSHEYLSRNSNAPLPGTSPGHSVPGALSVSSGANIYQFASNGNGNLESFFITYNVHLGAHVTGFGSYRTDKNYVDSEGAGHFTANPYDIGRDYGRSSADQAQTYAGGFQYALPAGFQVVSFLDTHTGVPFDITTGTDLNGDTIFNDRPSFAASTAGGSVVTTGYGSFNVLPAAGQTLVPRNYGTSPGLIWVQLQASKDFHLGPRPAAPAQNGKGPGERPWDLSLGVEVHNLTNHNNPGIPVGALAASACTGITCTCVQGGSCPLQPSPYFGHSLNLATDFSPNTASNRTILLQTSFTW